MALEPLRAASISTFAAMLRCFQVQDVSREAELVEVGNEHLQIKYGSGESAGFTPLATALAQILINDSQVQERLQGESSYGNDILFNLRQAAVSSTGSPKGLPDGWVSTAAAQVAGSTVQEAGAAGRPANSNHPSAGHGPFQLSSMPEAGVCVPRQHGIHMLPQHDSPPPESVLLRGVPPMMGASAKNALDCVPVQPHPVRQGLGRDNYSKRPPLSSFRAPRPCHRGTPISAHQAHTSRGAGALSTAGCKETIHPNTEGSARPALGPEQLDQKAPPVIRAESHHASAGAPASNAEQPADAALPQPSSVPAGVFHFGCKRPVHICEAAMSVGHELAEKGQWGLIRTANLAATAATPDLQHAEGRPGTSSNPEEPGQHQTSLQHAAGKPFEPGEATHCQTRLQREELGVGKGAEAEVLPQPQEGTLPEAACFAGSVPAALTQRGMAESHSSERHVARGGSVPGQASDRERDQVSLHQSDQAPSSPDHSACPEHGAFLSSAGIAMSSWGESQLLGLHSLPEHREADREHTAEADLPLQFPQDNMGAQLEAATEPAFLAQDATNTPARLTSHAGSSGRQTAQALQLGATLECQLLEAALAGELGAMHPQNASPALPCSSAPTQHEALGALEDDPATLSHPQPATSATQTASASATAGGGGAGAQEAHSRPCSATAGEAHASGKAHQESAGQPACRHAGGAMEASTLEENHDLDQNCIPATLAEEAEGPEDHGAEMTSGCGVPPTLEEEEHQQALEQKAPLDGAKKAAPTDLQYIAADIIVMQSEAGRAKTDDPDAPAVQETVMELAPTVAIESQPEDPVLDREQSSAPADTQEVDHRPAQTAEAVCPGLMENPFGLWSTTSGKPLQVSDAALQAAQLVLWPTTDHALEVDGRDRLGSAHMSQGVRDSAEPAIPAEQSAAQHACEATVAGQAGQSPEMHPPTQQEPQPKDNRGAGLAQLAPAPPLQPAAGQADAPAFAAASIWGTASGKPVHFSKDRMRAAAAIFGEDFPVALTPEAADAAATVTWASGRAKPLHGDGKEAGQLGEAHGGGRPYAADSVEAGSWHTAVDPASAPGSAGAEPAAALGVSERHDRSSWAEGAATGAERTPSGGSAEDQAAVPWQTASGKRLRVSPEALAAAASKLHLTAGQDRGHASFGAGAVDEVEETPSRGDRVAEAGVPWQTASGKRMRVSPEALAAAASRLHLASGPHQGHHPSEASPTLPSVAGKGSIAQAASPAQQAAQGSAAVPESSGAADPATPLQQQPADRAGQLSASTAGRKHSAQPPSSLAHSRARSGSTFKAPRKFMTPVSKFALQQGGRGTTPSRLQQASTAAPRQPLHDLQGTLAGRLLAEASITSSAHLSAACCHPDQAVLTMASKSAASHMASASQESATLAALMGSSRLQVMGEDSQLIGAADFAVLLHAAGAEPQHCSEAWVANHYRWVVWKLACYERRSPDQLAGRMLTLPVILDQLQYRYEREHGKGHRSVLQKVLEQDERPSRAMILCIAEVLRPDAAATAQQGGYQVQLEVTDGWYGVRATIDGPLCHYVASGVLRTGMKVRVCGAELRGGQPQAVLEASRSCSLTLHCNGVHRVDPDAKLGWTPYQSVVVPLTAAKPGGGLLPRTLVLVQRRYPPLYWDTLSDGRHVRRTPRAKAGADRIAEAQAEKAAEAAVAQVHAEERSHCRQLVAEAKTGTAVKTGALMHANRILSGDSLGETAQAAAREDLDDADRYQAERGAWMVQRREELMQAGGSMHVTRSTRFLPLEVFAVLPQGAAEGGRCGMRAVIEVSNPSEDIEGVAEGSCYMVTDLTAPDTRRSSASHLLLRTTPRTCWQLVPLQEAQAAYMWDHAPRRRIGLLEACSDLEGCAFDYEGIVLGVGQVQSSGAYGAVSQWLFLTDDSVGSAEGCSDSSLAPRCLAVQLQAHREAIDFLSPAADVGSVASLRDLRLRVLDTANNVWQADGNINTTLQLHTVQHCSRSATETGGSLQRLGQWALDNKPLLQSMQSSVQQLMAA